MLAFPLVTVLSPIFWTQWHLSSQIRGTALCYSGWACKVSFGWCCFPVWDMKSPSAGLSLNLNPTFSLDTVILSYVSLFFEGCGNRGKYKHGKLFMESWKKSSVAFIGKTWEYVHFSEGNISPPALWLLWYLMRFLMSAGSQGFLPSHQVPVITIVILNYCKWLISVVTPGWLVTFQSPLSCCLLIRS